MTKGMSQEEEKCCFRNGRPKYYFKLAQLRLEDEIKAIVM